MELGSHAPRMDLKQHLLESAYALLRSGADVFGCLYNAAGAVAEDQDTRDSRTADGKPDLSGRCGTEDST
jgi:hypothetical protein